MSNTRYKDLSPERKAARRKAIDKYNKTKQGFICRLYKNMRARTGGLQRLKAHLYEGLELLPRKEFYSWAIADKDFNFLFDQWENNGRHRKLTPSIDRIDSNRGYTLDNIRFITHSENSRNGSNSRWQNLAA